MIVMPGNAVVNTELARLIDEVRLLFHSMTQTAEALHGSRSVNASMRAVLEYLGRHGDSPVPRIAEARRVSRQHIQVIVNDLIAAGLVELGDNPAHRRSKLVVMTPGGSETLAQMMAAEHDLFAGVEAAVGSSDLDAASRTLSVVRLQLETRTGPMEP